MGVMKSAFGTVKMQITVCIENFITTSTHWIWIHVSKTTVL